MVETQNTDIALEHAEEKLISAFEGAAKELRDRGLHLGPKPAAGVVLGGVFTRGAAASMPAIAAMKTTATPKRSTGKDKKATAFSRAT